MITGHGHGFFGACVGVVHLLCKFLFSRSNFVGTVTVGGQL